jgi:hypothetical protein
MSLMGQNHALPRRSTGVRFHLNEQISDAMNLGSRSCQEPTYAAQQNVQNLLDHLVGCREKRRRHLKADRLGSLQVDHQLVFGRRLHREIGGLLTLEDAIDISRRAAVLVEKIRPVGDQPAGGDHEASEIDRGQLVPARQRDDQVAMNCRLRTSRHDQAAIGRAGEGRDAALDLARVAHSDGGQLHAERRCHRLNGREEAGPVGGAGFANDRRALRPGRDLLKQLQPFRSDAELE